MIVTAVSIARKGVEDDPNAIVEVEIRDENGVWYLLGTERLGACFSTCWHMPETLEEAEERYQIVEHG